VFAKQLTASSLRETAEKSFIDRDSAKIWIIKNQFGRRNLSNYDRSKLALELEPLIAEKAKERMLAGVKLDPAQKSVEGTTQKELATIAETPLPCLNFFKKHVDKFVLNRYLFNT